MIINKRFLSKANDGFTLVELAIVLVIIGLIVGGVLVGQDLIKAAQIRSVLNDMNKFEAAVYTFRSKYNSLPGDMANAETYWGTDAGCPNTPANTTPKMATCNGNSDGYIAYWDAETMFGIPSIPTFYEGFRAWQHLANAGLIPGSFTGTSVDNAFDHGGGPRINIPGSRISDNSGYFLQFISTRTDGEHFNPIENHTTLFGNIRPSSLNVSNPVITPAEMFSLDTKGDDGKPGTGKMRSYTPTVNSCSTDWNPATSIYNLAETNIACVVMFLM